MPNALINNHLQRKVNYMGRSGVIPHFVRLIPGYLKPLTRRFPAALAPILENHLCDGIYVLSDQFNNFQSHTNLKC